jgi:hypothetical protein
MEKKRMKKPPEGMCNLETLLHRSDLVSHTTKSVNTKKKTTIIPGEINNTKYKINLWGAVINT